MLDQHFEKDPILQTRYNFNPFPERKEGKTWQQRYEELKNSDYYDKPNQLFFNKPEPENKYARFEGYLGSSQLLDVIIRYYQHPQNALNYLNYLKNLNIQKCYKGSFYDPTNQTWENFIAPGNWQNRSSHKTSTQLYGIWAEALFDYEKAKKRYQMYKAAQYFNPRIGEHILWREYGDNTHDFENATAHTSTQLLDVLVQALFDKESARQKYLRLKQAQELWNPELKLWDRGISLEPNRINGTAIPPTSSIAIKTQLLGILCQALFDKKAARNLYAELKKTPFYDTHTGMWHSPITWMMYHDSCLPRTMQALQETPLQNPPTDININPQLLSILIDQELGQYPAGLSDNFFELPHLKKFTNFL